MIMKVFPLARLPNRDRSTSFSIQTKLIIRYYASVTNRESPSPTFPLNNQPTSPLSAVHHDSYNNISISFKWARTRVSSESLRNASKYWKQKLRKRHKSGSLIASSPPCRWEIAKHCKSSVCLTTFCKRCWSTKYNNHTNFSPFYTNTMYCIL